MQSYPISLSFSCLLIPNRKFHVCVNLIVFDESEHGMICQPTAQSLRGSTPLFSNRSNKIDNIAWVTQERRMTLAASFNFEGAVALRYNSLLHTSW